MSGGGKRGAGSATGAAEGMAMIPPGSRKIVQSLKEIVNCSEAEIYAMLKECNMDPSDAVHRLLNQDTFHEVKSKREKKKETKDMPGSRSRPVSYNPSRGARGSTDRGGRTGPNHTNMNNYGAPQVKLAHKTENGTNTVPTSVTGSGTVQSNFNPRSTQWEPVSAQNTTQATVIADGPPLPSQPSSGFQNNWSRMPGQLSMADIVRMGRPQGKPSSTHTVAHDTFHASHDPFMSNMSDKSITQPPTVTTPFESTQEFHSSQVPVSQDEDRSHEFGTGVGHYSSHDDWSLVGETSAGSWSTHPEISATSIYVNTSGSSGLLADEANIERDSCLDENQLQEEDANGNSVPTESIRSTSISDEQLELEDSGDSIHHDGAPLNGVSYHGFEHHEDVHEEISMATENLQQLSLQKGELGTHAADDKPAVIIPSHLQVTNVDCSHLSFGSFGSGVNATLSGSFPLKPLATDPELATATKDTPPDELNSRKPEYYDGEQLKSTTNDNVMSRTSTSTGDYDMPSTSQPQNVRYDTLDAAHGLQENVPSVSSYGLSATTQPTAAYSYPDPNLQMQNLSQLSSIMQPYANSLQSSLPTSLLAPSVQPPRNLDLPFSALLANQSMSAKYNIAAPSNNGANSLPEAKPEVFPTSQPTPQAMPSSNIHNAGSSALPQHLPIHPYSHPTLPLGHFSNMIGYPFLPPSYTFVPSTAFQQAYASNSHFHQSPAAAMKYNPLPQYKSSISGGNLPQTPALPPGYGGYTSSVNNIPANFPLNASTGSAGTTMGFDDALNSQYKEGSQYLHQLQHNDYSRGVSALPGSTFYGFQGQQSQQNGGFRQAQQQASQYGQMGYLNMYQSQGAPVQEQYQQSPSEGGNLSGSQGSGSHHIWQHGY